MAAALMAAACTQTRHEKQVSDLMETMSTRQKVAQLIMVVAESYDTGERRAAQDTLVQEEGIGGVIVMDDGLVNCVTRLNELQSISSIPMLVGIDGEWGPSMRFREFPFFPRQMQLGALPSSELVYKMGRAVGRQCRMAGLHVNFAPVVDININPANPVIDTRSFGEDRELVAEYGAAYTRGMQDAGIYACAKHFPGHGDTDVDSHRGLPVLTFTRERLDSLELYPFRRQIREGVAMVMMGHLSIPALDTTVSSISRPIVTGLLKEELGFDGIVITDALGMKGVSAGRKPAEVTLAAYKAGVDILLMPGEVRESIDLITEAVENGSLSADDLDARVRKVLMLKAGAGMFDEGYSPIIDTVGLVEKAHIEEDWDLIREISRQSVTVVQDRGGAIPLAADSKIAYLAYNATWKAPRHEGAVVNGLSGFDALSGVKRDGSTVLGNALAEAGADVFTLPEGATAEQLDSVITLTRDYDLVIVGVHDGSARPKKGLMSDETQIAMFDEWAASRRMIGIYFGSPYDMDNFRWHSECEAFIMAYADNEANEQAVAGLLTGEFKPKGSLPVSAGGYSPRSRR